MIMIWNLWGTSFFRALSSCEILPIVEKCDLGFCPFSSFRVGKDNEKIIIIFGFWSVESHKEKGDFLEWYLLFHEPLTVPWLIFLKLLSLNFLVISDNEGFFWWFYMSFSYFCNWNVQSFQRICSNIFTS